MTADFLIGLVKNQKTLELVLIILATFIMIGITFQLGIKFLKARVTPLQFVLGTLALSVFIILVRSIIPMLFALVAFILLMSLLLSLLGKANISKSLGFSCLLLIFNIVGEAIYGAIGMANDLLREFVLNNPFGVLVGILSESLIPVIVLVSRKESILPTGLNNKQLLRQGLIYLCGFVILMVCTINFYNNKLQLTDYISLLAASIGVFCLYFFNTTRLKKEIKTINENVEIQTQALQEEFDEMRRDRRKYDKLPPKAREKLESYLYDLTVFSRNTNEVQREIQSLMR